MWIHIQNVSNADALRKNRTRSSTTTTPTPKLVSSSAGSKITWTKNDELLILRGIVDYEDVTKLSYRSDWDGFYSYIKGSIVSDFSKVQLRSKTRKLKKRSTDNLAKSDDGKGPTFTNIDDDEIFKLSMIIWRKNNETECDPNVNMDQAKQDEQINENVEQAKDLTHVEHEQINENVEKPEDVPYVEHERASNIITKIDNGEKEKKTIDNGEKEKSEIAGVDEFCVLQDALEATLLLFPSTCRNHQKFLLQNLRNLEAGKGKELSDEWKALLGEEMKLNIKKMNFSAKLADVGGSD
ncbi:unnamed protein product [Arabis nemorensis]|uniref:Glabrous enhancer-binding protein-like DBD domain-containing protein n=1 Tax=Arabis nemorensis TaxID=586526 RepID=A0A565BJZ9_9BRAS|nr:unnamed protein product [Arabis nemorensis]